MPNTYFNTDWALNCTSNSADKFLKVLLEPQELNPQRKGQVWEVVIKAGIPMPNDRNPCELGLLQSRNQRFKKLSFPRATFSSWSLTKRQLHSLPISLLPNNF